MTLIERIRKGEIPDEVRKVASAEGLDIKDLTEKIRAGRAVIPRNRRHTSIEPLGIGEGLRTKINANIGSSEDRVDVGEELKKLSVAVDAGADTVMDLSTGGEIDLIRKEIIGASPVPVGTVPIYQAALEVTRQGRSFVDMDEEELFETIERHGEDGVDFITVHCGVTRASLERLRKEGRVLGIVSRGGALTAEWMEKTGKENPLYENFDRLLKIAKRFDMTLSLGDGLRPGCLADATDRCQIEELITLGELAKKALEEGVQVIVEGPGHLPITHIERNIRLQKDLCNGAPFYVLGPLVTDIAPGYDHITAAIGGALAGAYGADFLCYVTPTEHLGLPGVEDVREGVIASKIAAHVADIAKGIKGAMERDLAMARARKALDWDAQIRLSIDPERSRKIRERSLPSDAEVCTMCGSLCAIKISRSTL